MTNDKKEFAGRAKVGGEYGLNGEWYEGGQYLPSSENTVKGANKSDWKPPTGKQEIAPYVWEKSPVRRFDVGDEGTLLSIWADISSWVSYVNKGEYVKGLGLVGLQIEYSKPSLKTPTNEDYLAGRADNRWVEEYGHMYDVVFDENGELVYDEDNNSPEIKERIEKLIALWNSGERWVEYEYTRLFLYRVEMGQEEPIPDPFLI